jgi:hypothetical protein
MLAHVRVEPLQIDSALQATAQVPLEVGQLLGQEVVRCEAGEIDVARTTSLVGAPEVPPQERFELWLTHE